MKKISKEDLNEEISNRTLVVRTNDHSYYFFEESSYHISKDTLLGNGYVKYPHSSNFNIVKNNIIPLSNIESIQQEEFNSINTLILIGSISVVVILGIVILFTNEDNQAVYIQTY